MRKFLFIAPLLLCVLGCSTTSSLDVAGVHRVSNRGVRGEGPRTVLYFPMVNYGEPDWLISLASAATKVGETALSPTVGIVDASVSGANSMLSTARPREARDLVIEIDGIATQVTASGVTTSAEGTTISALDVTFADGGWIALAKPEGGEPEPIESGVAPTPVP